MSSQLSAHAITAQTAMTRISVSRCSTLPAHRGSASAEKCSTSFSADIAPLPSLIKGEPAQPVSPSEPARPFHALPLGCVLVWKFDRFARSTRHLLTALEEFDHLGVRFVSVQDQIDTDSPMGRAMFTIIGAMAELESSLISERVTAGMRAAEARGKHLGRPAIPKRVISAIEALAISTDLSVRQIHAKIAGQASRGIVGEIIKRARAAPSPGL